MSKELDSIIESCNKRLEFLNTQLTLQGCDVELNRILWWEAFKRLSAACEAKMQQRKMRWTASGDFSHLQSTPGVRF